MLIQKAKDTYQALLLSGDLEEEKPFVASKGWLQGFMARRRLTLRRTTTTCQKIPADLAPKLVSYCVYVRQLLKENSYSAAAQYAADETAVWLDCPRSTTIETVGVKDAPVRSTGHEKQRVTVMLCAKADGTKCEPYILIPRKRKDPEIEKKFGNKLITKYEGTNWMDNNLTGNFLQRVVGSSIFGGRKFLAWDSAKFHVSQPSKEVCKRLKIDMAVIPGGCTGFIQAPDVYWNKPFKDHFRGFYEDWLERGGKEYTKGGNLKAPSYLLVCGWILDSWAMLSAELIRNSFKGCGLNLALDGSEDNKIHCFKPDGKCPEGLALLVEKRQEMENSSNNPEVAVVELKDEAETNRNFYGLEESDSEHSICSE